MRILRILALAALSTFMIGGIVSACHADGPRPGCGTLIPCNK